MVKFDITVNPECKNCWGIFLDTLKKSFPEFAMYDGDFYFSDPEDRYDEESDSYLPPITEQDVQDWLDSFTCEKAEEEAYSSGDMFVDIVVKNTDPTITENLDIDKIWVNKKTGDLFTCIDNTPDKNIWVGTKSGKLIRPIPPADKFDFYGDGSSVAFYKLSGDTRDSGGLYNGVDTRIAWEPYFDEYVADSRLNGTIKIKGLPFDDTTPKVTVSCWFKWNGKNGVMPFGWDQYDIYITSGKLGFNTFRGDIYGIDFKKYNKKWVYLTVTFVNGDYGSIFVNGVRQELSQQLSSIQSSQAKMSPNFTIFGHNLSSGYRRAGQIGRLRIFSKGLSDVEVGELTMSEVDLIRSVGGEV